MSSTDDMIEANRRYAAGFTSGDLPAAPAKNLAVLTCMDARMDVEQILGLEIGDAHIIRNAGGRASPDAIRSLIISHWLLGTTDISVIHHTECGMTRHTNTEIQSLLRLQTGVDASHIDFLPMVDLEESVRMDILRLQESPFIAWNLGTRGFIYEVRTGQLHPVAL
jgi:carbonic anhydrase